MTIRDSHVLVTGGAGFIGSHLVAALAPANRVTVVDDLSTGKLANLDAVRCDLVRADVVDLGSRACSPASRSCSIWLRRCR